MKSVGPVVVIGASGHQGSAVLRHLGERGMDAAILLDGRGEGAAQWLRRRRAELVDPTDADALERSFRGASALFLVLDDPASGPGERLRQGKAIADAAARAAVPHVVYSAATGPDQHRVACDVGRAIEDHFRAHDLPLTVLRPGTVMEEIPWYWLSRYGAQLLLATPFEAEGRLPLIAIDDTGGLAVAALAEPYEFVDRTIEIAGDVSSPAAIAGLLTQELGEPVAQSQVQVEGVFMYQEASAAAADIAWLRGVYPRLHTLRSWLEDGGGLALCRRAVARSA